MLLFTGLLHWASGIGDVGLHILRHEVSLMHDAPDKQDARAHYAPCLIHLAKDLRLRFRAFSFGPC